jgi:hypothetical protein
MKVVKSSNVITKKQLKDHIKKKLDYCTGDYQLPRGQKLRGYFVWKENNNNNIQKKGELAGSIINNAYRIRLFDHSYLASDLVKIYNMSDDNNKINTIDNTKLDIRKYSKISIIRAQYYHEHPRDIDAKKDHSSFVRYLYYKANTDDHDYKNDKEAMIRNINTNYLTKR